MEKKPVLTLARALNLLVTLTFLCNLAALFFVPVMARMKYFDFGVDAGAAWSGAWDVRVAVLTCFLWFCGACTAAILWQARLVLRTILQEKPFSPANAGNMKRAAAGCFLISGAALVRTVWGVVYYRACAPLFTYNTLFCPIFLMAGLLFLVMSALFRQAAQIKAENDLTI